jgi:Tfp pilus assembly protein PilF
MLARRLVILVLLVGLSAAVAAGCAYPPRGATVADPLSADEHVRLGATYEREGEADLAARAYQAALRRDAGHAPAHVGLGNLAARRGDLAAAERYYRAALARDARQADALNNLAWVYLQRGGRADEAVALARRALEAQPARAAYYADTLGIALTRAGRPAEGLPVLKRALAAAPAAEPALRAEIHRHLAEAYRALGRRAEAAQADAESRRLAPTSGSR